jgi:hypothetical protein
MQPHQIKGSALKRPMAIYFKMERTRRGTIVLYTSVDGGWPLESVEIGLSEEEDILNMLTDMAHNSIANYQILYKHYPKEIIFLVNFILPTMV